MNYYEYIDSLGPSDDSKERLKSRVKSSLSDEKKRKLKKSISLIGLVACFAVFLGVFSTIKSIPQKPITTEKPSTDIINNTIVISEADDEKSLPQEIIINGVFYRQYCSPRLKEQLNTDNGSIVIKHSEIGNHICKLNENNIYDTDTERLEDINKAKDNEFYNADAYEYKTCTDNSVIIVKASNKYYFFHSFNLERNAGFEQLAELYSLDSGNKIKSIEVWQDEVVEETITGFEGEEITGTTSKDILVKAISDIEKNEQFLEILKLSSPAKYTDSDDIYYDIHRTQLNESMKSTDEYRLVVRLSNGSSFDMWFCSQSEYFEALESTYFHLNNKDMQRIIELIKD